MVGLEIKNNTQQNLSDFDIMFNKNPFAIYIGGVTNKITLPPPGMSVYGSLPCSFDKKNADAKNPPKHPFTVHVAMKTNLDVFYYTIPCKLNCIMNLQKELTKEEF